MSTPSPTPTPTPTSTTNETIIPPLSTTSYLPILQSLLLLFLLHLLYRLYTTYHLYSTRKKSLPFPNIPYTVPSPHWYFGHLRAIGSNVIRGQEHVCVTYASPTGISTFWTIHKPSLSFLRAEDVNTVLRYSFHRQHVPLLAYHFKKLLGQHSLIMTVGKEWKSNRAVVHRAFIPSALKDARVVMIDVTRRFVQSILLSIRRRHYIEAFAEDDYDENDNVNESRKPYKWFIDDVTTLFRCVTLDIFGLAAFGHDFQSTSDTQLSKGEDPMVGKAFSYLCEDMTRRTFDLKSRFNPAEQYYWIPTKTNRMYESEIKKVRGLLLEIIQKKREFVAQQEEQEERNNDNQKKKKRVEDLLSRILRTPLTTSNDENQKDSKTSTTDVDNVELTDEFLSDFLLTLLFAGFDTTSLSLVYALYLLAKHPEKQQKCVEEARAVLGWDDNDDEDKNKNKNGNENDKDFLLPPAPQCPTTTTTNDKNTDNKEEEEEEYVLDPIKELPYNYAVMLESIRLYPPVTNSVRDLGRPMDIDVVGNGTKTTIPAGTRVFMSLWWINRHEENFARPNEFLPERWVRWEEEKKCWVLRSEDPNDEVEKVMAQQEQDRLEQLEKKEGRKDDTSSSYVPPALRSNLLSFAAGGRSCVGQRFALQETPIILAYFVRDVRAELADENYELELVRSGPNQKPKDGLPVMLSQRL